MNKNLSELLSIKSTNVNLLKFICAILVIVGHANPITGTGTDLLTEYTGAALEAWQSVSSFSSAACMLQNHCQERSI